jgi:hypothetical protein
MPLQIPTFARTEDQETERLNNQRLGRHQYTPDAAASIAARVEQGFENSTAKVLYDLATRPSSKDDPKIPVKELYHDYPDMHWEEPLTRDQADWRASRLRARSKLQDTIDKREQGVASTVTGLGASIVTSALISPETYFAPVVGRMTVAAAAKVATTTSRVGKVTNTLAKLPMNKRFAVGFAEDAALTAAITEPTFATREELLENPISGLDYMTDVLISGTVSGLLNTGVGRLLDRSAMNQEIEYRAQELSQLVTGSSDPVVMPVYRNMAKAEYKVTREVGAWKARNGFDGEVRIGSDPKSDFVAAYSPEENRLTINTANTKRGVDFSRALDQALLDPGVPAKDLPSFRVKVGESGIEAGDNTRWRKLSEDPYPQAPLAPHTQYNLAQPKPDLIDIEMSRLNDEIGAYRDANPESVAEGELKFFQEATEEGAEISDTQALLEVQMKEVRTLGEANMARARDISKELSESTDSLPFPLDTETDRFAVQLLKDAGYDPVSIRRASPDQIEEAITVQMDLWMKNESLRALRQAQANPKWEAAGRAGRAEVSGRLDGSLVRGGKFFEGHGDNTYRRMETYRSRYSNLIHTSAIQQGVRKHIDKYTPESASFWSDVERVLSGQSNIEGAAGELARVYKEAAEHQRTMLNLQGAGIRKLEGFFLRTVHDRARIVAKEAEWKTYLMDLRNVDWVRMGYAGDATDIQARRDFIDAVFEEIDSGFHHDTNIEAALQGGRKGQAFAHEREIHFVPGRQTEYNDVFGRQNTARELMDQLELRAKAIAITETLGPDFKQSFRHMLKGLTESEASAADILQDRWHWDEITGETNTVVNQPVAHLGQNQRNLVNAMTLHGTGITVALTDPVSQVVNLRSSGLSTSLGRAARHVMDSYGEAFQAIIRNNDTEATKRIKFSILAHDTNLQSTRIVLGDSSIDRVGGLPERLSLATIKWSGAGIFTKISQMSTVISMQRRMAALLKEGSWTSDFDNQLSRFNIKSEDYLGLRKYIVDDQLSVYDIEDLGLRRKMQNMLDEGMRIGSLQADPKQTSQAKLGLKAGTPLGEGVRSVSQYLPTALAQHQKLLMRLAVMGGGDARFLDLVDRSRITEVATVLGMMLGSAVAVVSLKDVLRNKEPFWAGDQPLDVEHMNRILKVSGVVPLITEFMDTARGGMLRQMGDDVYKTLEAAGNGDIWQTFHQGKQLSPFVFTNLGPAPTMLENLVGMVSEEYLRDTVARRNTVWQLSGQGNLVKF